MGVMKNKILAALLELRRQVQKGDYPVTGICNFVECAVEHDVECAVGPGELSYYLSRAMRQWPKFSGDSLYPVPCGGMSPERAYDGFTGSAHRGRWLWEFAEYGMVRRELLDFLIEHFKGMTDAGS